MNGNSIFYFRINEDKLNEEIEKYIDLVNDDSYICFIGTGSIIFPSRYGNIINDELKSSDDVYIANKKLENDNIKIQRKNANINIKKSNIKLILFRKKIYYNNNYKNFSELTSFFKNEGYSIKLIKDINIV